jgi:hypothetical protein
MKIKVRFIKSHEIGIKEGHTIALHKPRVLVLLKNGYIEIEDKVIEAELLAEISEKKKCQECEDEKNQDCEECRKKTVKPKKSKP